VCVSALVDIVYCLHYALAAHAFVIGYKQRILRGILIHYFMDVHPRPFIAVAPAEYAVQACLCGFRQAHCIGRRLVKVHVE
jgi:hypothetical protein